jgi:Holliday junction resolvase
MAAEGSTYERELKNLLSGESKAISRVIKTCEAGEKEAYGSMIDEPFLVIRAAGSLGVDLVALRWDFSFPIEVKSSNSDTLHFSRNPRLGEQASQMLSDCQKSNLVPIYAFRLKRVRGDPWRVFTIPSDDEFRGLNKLLKRRIPEIETSSNGNYIMRWEDGMKLSDFISYMHVSRGSD